VSRPPGLQAIGKGYGAAQWHAVPAVDLVGHDAKAFGDDTSDEPGGKEPVVAAQQEPRGHRRPGVERPGFAERCAGLLKAVRRHLGGQFGRQVVQEQRDVVVRGATVACVLLAPGLFPPGVGPPLAGGFAGPGDHRRQQHQRLDRNPVTHQRRGERAEGVRDHDEVGAVADGVDHGVGVLGQPGRVVVARKVGRHDVVAPGAQLGAEQVPEPRVGRGAGDQHVGGHALPRRSNSSMLAPPGSRVWKSSTPTQAGRTAMRAIFVPG
jgi:hypothetical protein